MWVSAVPALSFPAELYNAIKYNILLCCRQCMNRKSASHCCKALQVRWPAYGVTSDNSDRVTPTTLCHRGKVLELSLAAQEREFAAVELPCRVVLVASDRVAMRVPGCRQMVLRVMIIILGAQMASALGQTLKGEVLFLRERFVRVLRSH